MKGGGEVLGNHPRLNVCQTSAHTHFENSCGCEGAAGGNCRRSALTAAGGFPCKERSQANPAGVKFHRSLSCNDITKHSAHTHTSSTPQPSPHSAPTSGAGVRTPLSPQRPGAHAAAQEQRRRCRFPRCPSSSWTFLKLVGD